MLAELLSQRGMNCRMNCLQPLLKRKLRAGRVKLVLAPIKEAMLESIIIRVPKVSYFSLFTAIP